MGQRESKRWRGEAASSGPVRPLWRLLSAQDLRDHPFQVVFIVLFLLATLVVPPVAAGIGTARRVRAREMQGTIVTATFIGGGGRRGAFVGWEYTYSYSVSGASFRGSFSVRSGGMLFEKGGPVAVFVDPSAPHRSFISRNLVTGWLLLTFLFWGSAALLLCLRHVPSGRHLLRPRYAWAFALVFTSVSFIFLPFAAPPERWWIVPLDYLAVLAITTLWLYFLSRNR
ncbi:MAG TPA: DUF3592 domain-containing protein [Thermoanaerobaculia bacterium]|nr:DUF3592 domain-containing protein [Thermoanaerobaculia bacterium]